MANLFENKTCCGVYDLKLDAASPTTCLQILRDAAERRESPIVIFTDRVSYGTGVRLAKYIRKHDLGTLIETDKVTNPNHNSKIKVWVWTVDWNAVKAKFTPTPRPDYNNYW